MSKLKLEILLYCQTPTTTGFVLFWVEREFLTVHTLYQDMLFANILLYYCLLPLLLLLFSYCLLQSFTSLNKTQVFMFFFFFFWCHSQQYVVKFPDISIFFYDFLWSLSFYSWLSDLWFMSSLFFTWCKLLNEVYFFISLPFQGNLSLSIDLSFLLLSFPFFLKKLIQQTL